MEAGWSSVRMGEERSRSRRAHNLTRLVLWRWRLSQTASGAIMSQSSGATPTNQQQLTIATVSRTKISFQHLLGSMDSVQKENNVHPGAYKNLVAGPSGWWVHCGCAVLSDSCQGGVSRLHCCCCLSVIANWGTVPPSGLPRAYTLENFFFFFLNASEASSELPTRKKNV